MERKTLRRIVFKALCRAIQAAGIPMFDDSGSIQRMTENDYKFNDLWDDVMRVQADWPWDSQFQPFEDLVVIAKRMLTGCRTMPLRQLRPDILAREILTLEIEEGLDSDRGSVRK